MQKTHLYKRCLRAIALVLALALPAVSLADGFKVVVGGALNLRKEPSTAASVLGQYPSGTWMNVLEEGDDWSKVEVAGKTGYVMSKYLADSTINNTLYVRTNTGIGLNLRKTPSMAGEILTSFKNGTAVQVLSKGNEWYRVQIGDVTGYMASRYLAAKPAAPSQPSTPAVPSGKQGVVNNPGANQVLLLREKASTTARVLGNYRNGTIVTITGESGDFYQVNVGGKNGFMMKKFVKVGDETPATPFTAKLVNPNGNRIVNFRKGPGLTAAVIDTYPVGTEITVTQLGDVWCKATIDGVEGYVSRYFFKAVTAE